MHHGSENSTNHFNREPVVRHCEKRLFIAKIKFRYTRRDEVNWIKLIQRTVALMIHAPLKRRSTSESLQGVIFQKAVIFS